MSRCQELRIKNEEIDILTGEIKEKDKDYLHKN